MEEGNKKVNKFNKSKESLLGTKHDVIAHYERTLDSSVVITPDKTLESSVDKPLVPDFTKRQGGQEAVDEGIKLCRRYEDLKRSLENKLAKVQEFLHQVQNYETSLNAFDEWLRKQKENVDSVKLCTCTIEKINTELATIKVININSYCN